MSSLAQTEIAIWSDEDGNTDLHGCYGFRRIIGSRRTSVRGQIKKHSFRPRTFPALLRDQAFGQRLVPQRLMFRAITLALSLKPVWYRLPPNGTGASPPFSQLLGQEVSRETQTNRPAQMSDNILIPTTSEMCPPMWPSKVVALTPTRRRWHSISTKIGQLKGAHEFILRSGNLWDEVLVHPPFIFVCLIGDCTSFCFRHPVRGHKGGYRRAWTGRHQGGWSHLCLRRFWCGQRIRLPRQRWLNEVYAIGQGYRRDGAYRLHNQSGSDHER
jgi:hypothetical protein